MQTLIDGFNLIYKIPELEPLMVEGKLHGAAQGLIRLLDRYSRGVKSKKIPLAFRQPSEYTIFIDGKKQRGIDIRGEKVLGIEVRYSLDLSADYLIKQSIRQAAHPRDITVVTSDKEIRRYSQRFGSKNISSDDFAIKMLQGLKAMESKNQTNPGEEAIVSIDENELEYWEQMFGGD